MLFFSSFHILMKNKNWAIIISFFILILPRKRNSPSSTRGTSVLHGIAMWGIQRGRKNKCQVSFLLFRIKEISGYNEWEKPSWIGRIEKSSKAKELIFEYEACSCSPTLWVNSGKIEVWVVLVDKWRLRLRNPRDDEIGILLHTWESGMVLE